MAAQGTPVNRLIREAITQGAVVGLLDWLQAERSNGNTTRNARLAAIHAFFNYIQYQQSEHLYECQKILSIPMKRKTIVLMNYRTIEGIKVLLEQPDTRTLKGQRDLALLSVMYDTGARVQEVIDLMPSSLRLDGLNTIRIAGKDNKTSIVPMLEDQVRLLKPYIAEHQLQQGNNNKPRYSSTAAEKNSPALA
jgi:integrase/recombinase XerD